MRTLAPYCSQEGRAALARFASLVESFDGAEEMISAWALELAFTEDDQASADLAAASRTIFDTIKRANPQLSESVANGLTVAFCELVATRVNEFKNLGGRA